MGLTEKAAREAGHEVRVAPSPFVESFEVERRRLLAGGATAEAARALRAGGARVRGAAVVAATLRRSDAP